MGIDATKYKLCEGQESVWHYHLCAIDSEHSLKALCGADTMNCGCPVSSWGFKPEHMPSSYCEACEPLGEGDSP